jgi:hypothetical protein
MLVGCTPDKAEALLAAVKVFRASSEKAILAAKSVVVTESSSAGRLSSDEIFEVMYAAPRRDFGESLEILEAQTSLGDQSAAATEYDKALRNTSNTLAMLSRAYASLPNGSFVGARYVGCGKFAVRKLTTDLLALGNSVANPAATVYNAKLQAQWGTFQALASSGNKVAAKVEFESLLAGIRQDKEARKEVLLAVLEAVENGKKLHEVLDDYNTISVASILRSAQHALGYVNSLEGLGLTDQISELNIIQAGIAADPRWAHASSISLGSLAKCPLNL